MAIDPVILQLRADLNQYLSTLKSTTTKVDQLLGAQEKSARQLEAQMARSSGAIAGQLRGLAGTLATMFTGRELMGLLDNFTRLQNQLRVAGLEGDALAGVQQRLFEIAGKYGVEVNSIAELYGRAAQAQKDLGASTGQLLQLTNATAQALKITGTSTQAASGAILGLTQALSSGIVRAEEFNQMNEGGLRPLLQVAAASERFGGSVAKLRNAVADGKVTSDEFFRGIMAGAAALEGQAGKATLTLAGAFTSLQNKLIEYVGTAGQANGVTTALAGAIQYLADSLDTIIPALAIIATALGVKYVAGAVAAAGASAMASNAMFALQARALGAATSMEALTFAMNGMKGGLITAALLAIGGAIYYLRQQTHGTAEATGIYAKAQAESEKITKRAGDAAEKLATAHGKAREEALALARAEAENIKQKLASARASVVLAQAELARARARTESLRASDNAAVQFGGLDPSFSGLGSSMTVGQGGERRAEANLSAAEATAQKLENSLKAVESAISGFSAPGVSNVAGGKGKGRRGGSGGGGPSLAEIADRFNGERAALAQQALSAEASMARSAQERAELELRGVELARIRTRAGIEAEKDYSAAQKAILLQQVEVLAELERERVEFDKRRQLEQEAQQIADQEFRSRADALQVQFDLADSQGERKRLALEILRAEQEHLKATLEAVIASKTASEADRQRARVALDSLTAISAGQAARTAQQNETPAERYMRELNKSPEAINEAIDGIKIDGLDALNDGLVEAIMGTRSLGDVFKSVANQIIADLLRIAVQKMIVNSIAGAVFGGSGGGGGGSFQMGGNSLSLGTITGGRASGGYVNAGQMYRVNEAASAGRVEAFVPQDNGYIIPLGRMNAAAAQGGANAGKATVRLELSGDIDARIQQVSGPVAVQVVRATAPSIIDASARETMNRSRRPGL